MRLLYSSSIIPLAMVLSSFGNVVWAHHSVAGYDREKYIELHGVIKEFNWKNPHVYVIWDVKDADGKMVEWAGVMNSPTSMMQLGMNRNSLKPGDEVVISLSASKPGNPIGLIHTITMADGRPVIAVHHPSDPN